MNRNRFSLEKAVKQFSGNTAEGFLREMTAAVERRIVLFLQHPHEGWPV
ncbi:MAG: hypothetical protein WD278_21025 [Pirellulales bacterium]